MFYLLKISIWTKCFVLAGKKELKIAAKVILAVHSYVWKMIKLFYSELRLGESDVDCQILLESMYVL